MENNHGNHKYQVLSKEMNEIFDPSTPSMRKGCDGGKKRGAENGKKREENNDENSGHYVIASSRPPERRPLEHGTLVPIQYRTTLKIIL